MILLLLLAAAERAFLLRLLYCYRSCNSSSSSIDFSPLWVRFNWNGREAVSVVVVIVAVVGGGAVLCCADDGSGCAVGGTRSEAAAA